MNFRFSLALATALVLPQLARAQTQDFVGAFDVGGTLSSGERTVAVLDVSKDSSGKHVIKRSSHNASASGRRSVASWTSTSSRLLSDGRLEVTFRPAAGAGFVGAIIGAAKKNWLVAHYQRFSNGRIREVVQNKTRYAPLAWASLTTYGSPSSNAVALRRSHELTSKLADLVARTRAQRKEPSSKPGCLLFFSGATWVEVKTPVADADLVLEARNADPTDAVGGKVRLHFKGSALVRAVYLHESGAVLESKDLVAFAAPVAAKTDAQVLDELAQASSDLLLTSESDYPFEKIQLASVDAAELRKALGLAANAPLETVGSADWFDNRSTLLLNSDPADEAGAAVQTKALRAALEANLTDLRVYRVGEIQVHVLIVGKTKNGTWVGLHSISIET